MRGGGSGRRGGWLDVYSRCTRGVLFSFSRVTGAICDGKIRMAAPIDVYPCQEEVMGRERRVAIGERKKQTRLEKILQRLLSCATRGERKAAKRSLGARESSHDASRSHALICFTRVSPRRRTPLSPARNTIQSPPKKKKKPVTKMCTPHHAHTPLRQLFDSCVAPPSTSLSLRLAGDCACNGSYLRPSYAGPH